MSENLPIDRMYKKKPQKYLALLPNVTRTVIIKRVEYVMD